MIEQRHLYGWVDPVFHESPGERTDDEVPFAATTREPPAGWARTARDVWTVMSPDGLRLPDQGWKIHVSAVAEHAESVVDTVWDYCTSHGLSFKFLRSHGLFELFNSKYMPRQASGKLIAVYPSDETELEAALAGLGELLADRPGPSILTDLRWEDGPLHVRYGAFRKRQLIDDQGREVLAMERPDGTLVPDERRPGHYAPSWVPVPGFLAPQVTRRTRGTGDFPYRVQRALHFSNGGGVYLAERLADGRRVVLKEARPGAGVDSEGRDAVERLDRERWALERLAGVEGVPELYEHVVSGGHHFLAMEYREGEMLWLWVATYHPLLFSGTGARDEAGYARRVEELAARVQRMLDAIHARGVVVGDLHPGNILVTPDGRLSLVDFEAAFPADDGGAGRPALGAQGFMAPPGFTGTAVDHYALGALRGWFFLPVNRLFPLAPGRQEQFADAVEQRFGPVLGAEFLAAMRTGMTPQQAAAPTSRTPAPDTPPAGGRPARLVRRDALLGLPLDVDLDAPHVDWAAARASLVSGILLSATPHREDRLFPGDVQQFVHGGSAFGHGAAGVLWALDACGAGRFPEHEDWLLASAERGLPARPGFWTGLHGIAHVLAGFGHEKQARALAEQAAPSLGRLRNASLFDGLAGAGLGLLDLAVRYGDDGFLAQAEQAAGRLSDLVREPADSWGPGPGQAGLMRGWSGVALFLLRMYEATGEERQLDLAVRALDRDLAGCVPQSNGSLQVADRGVRTLAYLDVGSGGIALVADELLTYRQDAVPADLLTSVRRACQAEFVVEPHLLNGRSGLMAVVARLAHRDPGTEARDAVDLHLRRLTWHKLSYRGHLAFAGEQSYRLSADLATGTAGILLGITAALDGSSPFLPFLSPRPQEGGVGTGPAPTP
ncbi:class III lanthionine synthetase LanKC [Streptomyces sp. A3M-1-3]|uniref:class III lanthionine synthetase LanKC n=1 Tax=Streptomyces sp. A3M-1-3 TaxID=2962044 RepID=UPI0020B7922F|nr:class III lanthionine synthetase LanKC [Streptomyces sp. A3M-1-3]MCP3821632.1 class III lanthionine synthetase LanKC [Streptomyces sp. A3M-1-3]